MRQQQELVDRHHRRGSSDFGTVDGNYGAVD
jgi:hypothetical protein